MVIAPEADLVIKKNYPLQCTHLPEAMCADLCILPVQQEGTWCNGFMLLEALHPEKIETGEAQPFPGTYVDGYLNNPEYIPNEWKKYTIAFFGTIYGPKDSDLIVRQKVRVLFYDHKEQKWKDRYKEMDSDFCVVVERNNNIRIIMTRALK